jgi:hypothetical protein
MKSREERIYLAYKATKKAFLKEGIKDRLHARALLYLAETFSLSPLRVHLIVKKFESKKK